MLDFLIFYEVGVREFESIALLGYELKRRGYSVEYLGFQQTDFNKHIKNKKLLMHYYNNVDTVIMPSLYNDKEIYNTIYYVCGKCKHIVNLRWEQYFENYVMEDLNSVYFPQGLAKKVYHLCWGEVSRQSLLDRGVKEEFVPVTGPIHMDFLRPEFQDFYETRESLFPLYNLNPSAHTVLYISSFATATMTERLQAKVENDFDGEFQFRTDTFDFHRKSYELTIDWIESFIKQYRDIQFIYRPHPAENITDYITKLKKYPNFRIILEKSVKQWIISCDTITTWVSTSIAEAFFAGKQCHIIRPIPYPNDVDICIYKGAHYIESKEDFLRIRLDRDFALNQEIDFYPYYDVNPEKASYMRIVEELELIKRSSNMFEWDDSQAKMFDLKRKKLFGRNMIFNMYLSGLKASSNFQKITGIKYKKTLQDRVENYNKGIENAKVKASASLASEINRIEVFMKR